MLIRFLWLLMLVVAIGLAVIELERQYRELQALKARQVYQKQVLLEEESRLRLALQRIVGQEIEE